MCVYGGGGTANARNIRPQELLRLKVSVMLLNSLCYKVIKQTGGRSHFCVRKTSSAQQAAVAHADQSLLFRFEGSLIVNDPFSFDKSRPGAKPSVGRFLHILESEAFHLWHCAQGGRESFILCWARLGITCVPITILSSIMAAKTIIFTLRINYCWYLCCVPVLGTGHAQQNLMWLSSLVRAELLWHWEIQTGATE